jgi:hypothetical protein
VSDYVFKVGMTLAVAGLFLLIIGIYLVPPVMVLEAGLIALCCGFGAALVFAVVDMWKHS